MKTKNLTRKDFVEIDGYLNYEHELKTDGHLIIEGGLGLPEWLARLEDTLFENMSREKSKTFPLKFLKAIPVDVNLDKTYHKFCKFILTDITKGYNEEPVRKAIETILTQHEKAIKGEIITIPELGRMYSAAKSAAKSAAWSVAFDKMANKLIELLKESEIQSDEVVQQ